MRGGGGGELSVLLKRNRKRCLILRLCLHGTGFKRIALRFTRDCLEPVKNESKTGSVQVLFCFRSRSEELLKAIGLKKSWAVLDSVLDPRHVA